MSRSIIVSGCNSSYSPLFNGLLSSIETARCSTLDIGLLDVGLTSAEHNEYTRRGVTVVKPKWDCDLKLFHVAPNEFFKAMTARPILPKYFPGYDLYMWIDADAWVQDINAINLYMSSAQTHGFAATPEVDRSYSPGYGNRSVISWRHDCFSRCFDDKIARQLAFYPMVNCGVFAARANAPHWDLWSNVLAEILGRKRELFFFADQIALNMVIRCHPVKTAFLPATFNWMCNRARPICSDDGSYFMEPNPPFQMIGIVHLTADTKNEIWEVTTLSGASLSRSPRYGGEKVGYLGRDVQLPKS
jgi:lipopolysaccharide biosynthesis glycosyltransferase